MKPHIKIDRPHLSSDDIARTKDFSALLKSYAALKNPLYKIWWLGGISTMIVIGTIAGLSNKTKHSTPTGRAAFGTDTQLIAESAPTLSENKNIIEDSHTEAPEDIIKLSTPAKLDETDEDIESSSNIPGDNDKLVSNSDDTQDNHTENPDGNASDAEAQNRDNSSLPETTPETKKVFTAMDYNPHVAGIYDGNIDQSVLLSNAIETVYPFEILSFKMGCPAIDEDKEYLASGNVFSAEMKNAIKSLPHKSIVYFYDIMGKDENGKVARLRSLRLFVVN